MTTLRYQVSKPVLHGNEKKYVQDALNSGWISSSGKYISEFEDRVSRFLGLSGGIAVSSGTTALHLACEALGFDDRRKVIVPALTYVATANAVSYCGGVPIFADCEIDSWNISIKTIEKAWVEGVRGVIITHLYGQPAPADEIRNFCARESIWLIEDCAEAFGAEIKGQSVGQFGDVSIFSFYGNKIISTGEGGMVFARNDPSREKIRMLKGQGMSAGKRYWHSVIGYNYRMTNVAAAIGCGQVEDAELHLSERYRIASKYMQEFRPLEDEGLVQFPANIPDYRNVYWLFSMLLKGFDQTMRDRLIDTLLNEHGIETRPFFIPMHLLPIYKGSKDDLMNSEIVSAQGINLPTYTGLPNSSIEEISGIVSDVIRSFGRE